MSNQKNSAIIQQTELLKNTTEMIEYLDILKTLRSEYLIILGVKDSPGKRMLPTMLQQIRELGFSKFDNQLWYMYAGIIYKSDVLLDESGIVPEMPVFHECDIDGYHIEISSESYLKGNRSVISINGNDYSTNGIGMNIVVYDLDNNELVDSIAYDSHTSPTGIFKRGECLTQCQKIDVEGALSKILRDVEALSKRMDSNQYKTECLLWNNARIGDETSLDVRKRFFRSLHTENQNTYIWQKSMSILLSELVRICEENNIDYWLDWGTLFGAVRHGGFVPWDEDMDMGIMRKDLPKLEKAIAESDTFIRMRKLYYIRTYSAIIYRAVFKDPLAGQSVDIFTYDYCENDSAESWYKCRKDKENYFSQTVRFRPVVNANKGKTPAEYFTVTDQNHINEIASITNKIAEESYSIENGDYVIMGFECVHYYKNIKPIHKTSEIFPLKKLEFDGTLCKVPNQYEKYLNDLYGDIYCFPDDILTHFKHVEMSQEVVDKCLELIEKYSDKH